MRFSGHTASAVNEFRGSNAALAPAAYASRIVLPPPLQGSLPAGWLAFTGRELNPLDRYKRFQITSLVPLFWIYPGAREVSCALLPPPHSITSSARASSVVGMSSPIVLAALRLIT